MKVFKLLVIKGVRVIHINRKWEQIAKNADSSLSALCVNKSTEKLFLESSILLTVVL